MNPAIITKEQVESNPGTKLVLDWFKQTYGVDLPVKEKEADGNTDHVAPTEQASTELNPKE